MKRTVFILAALMLFSLAMQARMPHISYGLEWGYTATFFKHAHYNFICDEGYRINEKTDTWRYFSNGAVMANVGVDITRHLNVSAYSGLLGVYSKRWVIPAELRLRYCPLGLDASGPLIHAGAAAAFPTSTLTDTGARGILGGGYRLAIYKSMSVDFLISLNLTLDHDNITDPDTKRYVPRSDITSNVSEYCAVNVSVALNF